MLIWTDWALFYYNADGEQIAQIDGDLEALIMQAENPPLEVYAVRLEREVVDE